MEKFDKAWLMDRCGWVNVSSDAIGSPW